MDDLLEVTGNAVRGKVLFDTTGKCLTCHVVNETGREVGPGLADIGDKLSRQSILESILFPSAAISHGYESYLLQLEGGRVTTGLLVSDAGGVVTLKEADGISRNYDKADVEEMLPQTTSLMPSDLAQTLPAQELMDIVEYSTTLKKPQPNKP